MKTILFSAGLFLCTQAIHAQNTNPWPSTGDVGIGTTSPAAKLHVQGTGSSALIRIAETTSFTDFIQNGNISTINASSNFLLNWGNNSLSFEGNAAGKFNLSSTNGAFINGYGGFKVGVAEKFGFYTSAGAANYGAIGAVMTDANNLGLRFFNKNAGVEAEAIRINPNGNVGVGTTADNGNKLQVHGDISLTNGSFAHIKSPNYPILLGDEGGGTFFLYGNTTSKPIFIGTANGGNFHKVHFQKLGQPGDDLGNYNFIYNSNLGAAFHIYNYVDTKTKLLLTAPGNLILNGTTDNNNKLQVNGTMWATGLILPTGAAAGKVLTSDVNGNATWQTAAGSTSGWSLDGNAAGAVKMIGTTDAYDLKIITGGQDRIVIGSDGNISMGKTAQQARLSVNGDIVTRKVKVTATGWADYVFKPGYALLPLPEVENYIRQHGHLPEMPSAAEVEVNGVELGANQVLLLKKIEELTLHAIAQNKQIDTSKQEVLELKQTVQELLKRIDKLEKEGK